MDTCPVCGAPLEATVVTYLSEVKLDEKGQIISFEVWEGNDSDGRAWDHQATRVYCANDHDIEWMAPADVTGPLTPNRQRSTPPNEGAA